MAVSHSSPFHEIEGEATLSDVPRVLFGIERESHTLKCYSSNCPTSRISAAAEYRAGATHVEARLLAALTGRRSASRPSWATILRAEGPLFAADAARATRADIYTRITDRIVADLERGVRPWHRPWSAGNMAGKITRPLRHNGIPYQGINVVMLWSASVARGEPIAAKTGEWLSMGSDDSIPEMPFSVAYARGPRR